MTDERVTPDVRLREEEREALRYAICAGVIDWNTLGTTKGDVSEHIRDAAAPTVERIVAARVGEVVERVEAVLIENRRATTNQPWLWDKVYDALKATP